MLITSLTAPTADTARGTPRPQAPGAQHDCLLVGITGAAGSGKSTVGEYLASAYGFECVALADAIKDMLTPLLVDRGEDYAALFEPGGREQPLPAFGGLTTRRMLQQFGDAGRALEPDFWVRQCAHRLGLHALPHRAPVHDRIAVTDIRYPNEAAWLHALGGRLLALRGNRSGGVGEAHSSEQHHRRLQADFVLSNDHATPLPELLAQVDEVARWMGIGSREGR